MKQNLWFNRAKWLSNKDYISCNKRFYGIMFALVIGRSNFKLKTKKIVTNFEFFMKAINDFGQKNETLTSKKSNFHQVKTNLYR